MSIDPGLSGSGYAIWEKDRLQKSGVVASRAKGWREQGEQVAAELHSISRAHTVEKVFCEYPEYFQSAGGLVTARSGSLVKLAWFCGFLNALFATEFIPFEFVEVNLWKGQLKKDIVEQRVKRILRCKTDTIVSHAIDAVGIGLFVHGRMK